MRLFIIISLITSILLSCKTDFDVNAPHDTVPIIFGFLDQSTDTQYIKINRTFLGTNNVASAAVNDSNLFENVTARVEQYTNGVLGNVYNLQEKWVSNLDDGIFYTDSQKVYFFVEPNLDENSTYRLIGNGDGKEFSAETGLTKMFTFNTSTKLATQNGYRLSLGNGTYGTVGARWSQSINAERYDAAIRFFYDEYTTTGDISKKHIDWFIGSQRTNDAAGGQFSLSIEGELFYQFIGTQAELANTTGIDKRVIKGIDLRVTAADDILTTFIDVNTPSGSIITERPEFTNIAGGFGIFASRQVLLLTDRTFDRFSVEELAEGQYTNGLLFCSDSVDYIGQTYHCP